MRGFDVNEMRSYLDAMDTEAATIPADVHTTALTADCQRRVLLTAQGKAVGEMPTALYRGNLVHDSVGFYHSGSKPAQAVSRAHGAVAAKADQEHRPLTPAVLANAPTIQAETVRLLEFYGERHLGVLRPGAKLIGVELPIRWTVTLPGLDEPTTFASHLDVLWGYGDGTLDLWDLKSQEEAPTREYLARNIQLGLYYLMLRYGEVLIDPTWDAWTNLGKFPRVHWVHWNHLAPYGKATRSADDNGEERDYKKGEHRPLHRIWQACGFQPECEATILEELSVRVRMQRAGLYPTNPSEVGCFLCECRRACPSFSWSNE